MNEDAPHSLIGSDTIKKCSIVGVGMVLEEVRHWGVGFEVSNVQASPSVSLSVACQSICGTLGYLSASCLPACHHTSHPGPDDN